MFIISQDGLKIGEFKKAQLILNEPSVTEKESEEILSYIMINEGKDTIYGVYTTEEEAIEEWNSIIDALRCDIHKIHKIANGYVKSDSRIGVPFHVRISKTACVNKEE